MVSGTSVYFHKYIGPVSSDNSDPSQPNYTATEGATTASDIQDLLFLENRDRVYDKNIYELMGWRNINDQEFNLSQFGLFIDNDTVYLSLHLNDTLNLIGRKPLSGDVIELPHERDDALLDPNAPAINKFYVVQDVSRETTGYSPTWHPHIIRLKCSPLTNAQEFSDILNAPNLDPFGLPLSPNNGDETIGDIMSNVAAVLDANEAIIDAANQYVKARNFETQHLYFVPGSEFGNASPWIFAGDGIPPDGAVLLGKGSVFPQNSSNGDFYLRTDYSPYTLYEYQNGLWLRIEIDYRGSNWQMCHRILSSFINNDNKTTYNDGSINDEKVPLSKAITLKPDLL